MRIGARLRLNTWIILAIMSLMVLFLIWSFWESNKADRNEGLVVEMQRIASERVVLRDEYLMRREERARVQWNAKTEHFRKLLDNAWGKFTDTRDKEILKGIQKRFDETVLIFSQLTDYREKRKDAGNESSIFPDREMQLISYIIANTYDLMNNINSLRQSASRASNTAHERSTILVIFSLCLVVILTIGNSVIINHILTKRITELSDGTNIIGGGNLHHRIPVTGNDELAELAGTINEMSNKLQGSYTSVENLEQEITERKKAEETLRTSESFLNSVISQSPLSTWISDEKGTLLELNQALRDLMHISDEEVVGKYNIFEDNIVVQQGFLPLVKSVFENGSTVRFEITYDTSQLKHLELEHTRFMILDVTVFPIRDGSGSITNAVIQHIDVTARRKAEQTMKDQLDELLRWQEALLGRDDRNQELKREVNELLRQLGKPIRYPSQVDAVNEPPVKGNGGEEL